MTLTATPFDEADFHARQRARLCNPRLMPAFTGRWAESLATHLQQQVPECVHLPLDQQAVVECFATAPLAEVEGLFHALSEACRAVPDLDEGAALWATELTVFAAFRVLDSAAWAGLSTWQGEGSSFYASVRQVPSSSSLVASLGLALLTGRYIRVKDSGQPRGVFDLTAAHVHTDPVSGLLAALFDRVFADETRRLNPDAHLSPDELGSLRAEFATFRRRRELAVPYILLPPLDSEARSHVETEFARTLNCDVVSGRPEHADELVLPQAQFTVASLKATVEKVFRMLPHMAPRDPAHARKDTTHFSVGSVAPAPATAPAPAPPPPQAYTWDVFISHTTADKAVFVDSLAGALQAAGLRVWYDTHELAVGDSLRAAISTGLRDSRFGVVVLSPRYLEAIKGWAHGELDTLLAYEFNSGKKRVLPVWLDLKRSDVEQQAPMLAGKVAVDAAAGLPTVVQALLAAITRGS